MGESSKMGHRGLSGNIIQKIDECPMKKRSKRERNVTVQYSLVAHRDWMSDNIQIHCE